MLQDLKYFLPYIFNRHVLLLMESLVIINGVTCYVLTLARLEPNLSQHG